MIQLVLVQLDASADGYVRSESSAMMALAHPACATDQSVPVMALLAASAVNQVC